MPIKTILVPVPNLPQARGAIETAFLVAQRYSGHVVGLHLCQPVNVDAVLELAAFSSTRSVMSDRLGANRWFEDDNAQAARRLFEDVRQAMQIQSLSTPGEAPGPSASFEVIDGDGPEVLAEQARVFDLVVAGQPTNDPGHSLRETLKTILFHAGRPVLSAPEHPPSGVGETVMIAWNRSALSARAAAIARSYFKRAKKVGVLSISAQQGRGPTAEKFAENLAWHGIEAELIEAELGDRRLGDAILHQAAEFGADLLVMGAYSQSPFRESLTRGVTNHILSHAKLPVLMAH